jgi:hypothetical protein
MLIGHGLGRDCGLNRRRMNNSALAAGNSEEQCGSFALVFTLVVVVSLASYR